MDEMPENKFRVTVRFLVIKGEGGGFTQTALMGADECG